MKRVFETAECEEVRNSIFLAHKYEKQENQMKCWARKLKVCDCLSTLYFVTLFSHVLWMLRKQNKQMTSDKCNWVTYRPTKTYTHPESQTDRQKNTPGTSRWCSSWSATETCGVCCGRRLQWDSSLVQCAGSVWLVLRRSCTLTEESPRTYDSIQQATSHGRRTVMFYSTFCLDSCIAYIFKIWL